MKKIFTMLMLAASILCANATELVCEGLVHRAGNNNCKYQPTFSWTASNSNTMQVFTFELGEFAAYDTMKIVLSDFVDMTEGKTVGGGNKVRLLFLAGSTTVKTQQFATINGGEKVLDLATLITSKRDSITEIAIGGSCAAGSVAVDPSSIKLVKADGTELVCAGFEKRPSNNKCAFGNVFSWSAASANTMELFSLDSAALAAYDTLHITMSNFTNLDSVDVGNGYKVRVLFLSGSTTVKTQNFSNIGGEKKIAINDIMSAEEIASVDLIAIGGACPAGSVIINASDVVLTGENQEPQALNRVEGNNPRCIKVIENGRIVIIHGDERFDLTGRRL